MRARLQILAAAVLWSTAGAAIKLTTLDAWQVSGGRSAVAAAALLLLVPEARRWPSKKAWAVAVAYAATVTLFVIANKLTTAANAIFLQDAAPLYVLLLSPWLLRERPTRGELLAVPVFLVGLALFFFDQLQPGQLLGNAVAVVSGVAFALCIMGLRAVKSEGPAVLASGNLLAALVVAPLVLHGPTPVPLDGALLLGLGVFQLALAYVLFSKGLARTSAIEASLLILLEPVLSPVWTYLFTGERPGPWALAGGAVILAATAWRTVAAPRAQAPAGELAKS
jgi:drug/metabolite transporter (DMT)-like permease